MIQYLYNCGFIVYVSSTVSKIDMNQALYEFE